MVNHSIFQFLLSSSRASTPQTVAQCQIFLICPNSKSTFASHKNRVIPRWSWCWNLAWTYKLILTIVTCSMMMIIRNVEQGGRVDGGWVGLGRKSAKSEDFEPHGNTTSTLGCTTNVLKCTQVQTHENTSTGIQQVHSSTNRGVYNKHAQEYKKYTHMQSTNIPKSTTEKRKKWVKSKDFEFTFTISKKYTRI